jgi:hypothetical protein
VSSGSGSGSHRVTRREILGGAVGAVVVASWPPSARRLSGAITYHEKVLSGRHGSLQRSGRAYDIVACDIDWRSGRVRCASNVAPGRTAPPGEVITISDRDSALWRMRSYASAAGYMADGRPEVSYVTANGRPLFSVVRRRLRVQMSIWRRGWADLYYMRRRRERLVLMVVHRHDRTAPTRTLVVDPASGSIDSLGQVHSQLCLRSGVVPVGGQEDGRRLGIGHPHLRVLGTGGFEEHWLSERIALQ